MKRSFREPKNRYKIRAKIDHQKISTLKYTQALENKENFNIQKHKIAPELAINMAQIRHFGEPKDD